MSLPEYLRFELIDQTHSKFTLDSLKQSFAIIYVYPKDLTPGCSVENHDFSVRLAEFEENNIAVIGVSKDTVESHQAFCNALGIKVTLVADIENRLTTALGAYTSKTSFGKTYMGLNRNTYLIDLRTGKIVKEWLKVQPVGHAQKVLEESKKLLVH
jgi:thioredoxin-dependent peroxiredoxin